MSISKDPVDISGAGMSILGPIQEPKFFENDLAKLILSDFDKSEGLTHIFPPYCLLKGY